MSLSFFPATRNAPEGLREFLLELGHGEHGFQGTEFGREEMSLDEYLRHAEAMAQGKRLRPGQSPMTTYWILDETNRIVGMSRLRHTLTEQTLYRGGHIGYYVRPCERRKGYATAILARMLQEADQFHLPAVLLTTEADNLGSISVIEANGGRLEDERIDPRTGRPFRRYWIQRPDGQPA